jgi:hypothetical protein
MADLSKFTDKLGLQKIIDDVKSIISPIVIPEANKDDPVGYCLFELSKAGRELADHHAKQADIIAKFSNLLESLHRELNGKKNVDAVAITTATTDTDTAAVSDVPKDAAPVPTEAAVEKEAVSPVETDSDDGSQQ